MSHDGMSHDGLMAAFPPPPEGQVTLANWRLPPFNRWAFRHVRELIPTALIDHAGGASRLESHPGALEHLAFQGPNGDEWTLARLLPGTFTDALLVLQRGHVVFEWYEHGCTPRTPHIVFSVSKSITATLAGVLAGDGRLDPEAPVTRYIPEAAGSAYGDCSVRHVLDMTVSMDFVEDYLDTTGAFARYRAATGWTPPAAGAPPADLRSFLMSLKRDAAPHGHTFRYLSPNTDLLGWVLERAAGMPYAALLSQALWQPMGAGDDGYVTVDGLGAPRAAGGICMTVRDLARVGELMRCGGMANGHQVVPAWWVDDILAGGDPGPWSRGAMSQLFPGGRYRSKWYCTGNAHGAFCGIGIHGQWIYVDPDAEVVVAKHSSQPQPVDEPMDYLLLAAFDAIARFLQR